MGNVGFEQKSVTVFSILRQSINRTTQLRALHMRKARHAIPCLVCLLTFVLSGPSKSEPPFKEMGYPRPFSFREVSTKKLPHLGWMTMVVSDFVLRARQGADFRFKEKYPDRPVLVQINSEAVGLYGTWVTLPKQRLEDLGLMKPLSLKTLEELGKEIVPVMDFPGYWTYDAGTDSTSPMPADKQVFRVGVQDMTPFALNTHPQAVQLGGKPSYRKDVVIYPRDESGEPDWLDAEFATIVESDLGNKTLTFRRWETSERSWPARPAGVYIAPNSSLIVRSGFEDIWVKYLNLSDVEYFSRFLPNLTRFCPRDPRTGLNAAEWLALHYINVKKDYYATLDGYVFDVSAGTFHPSDRISMRADCDNDGRPDYFYFDNLDFWALAMYDFADALRNGVEGKFEGLGDDVIFVTDSNMNEEARFFDLYNGAEYEFGIIMPYLKRDHEYSGNLDRYLLWTTMAREPRMSYIHNKFPVDSYHSGDEGDLAFYMHDNYYRLDMATACMGTGYVGKEIGRPGGHPAVGYPQREEQIAKYKTTLPLEWDEYDCGEEETYNWLGMPVGEPVRITEHLGENLFDGKTRQTDPVLEVDEGYVSRVEFFPATESHKVRVVTSAVQPWNNTNFNIRLAFSVTGLKKDHEYTLRLKAQAPSPYAKVDAKYASIPINMRFRLSVGEVAGREQEAMVFAKEREIILTLIAPETGDGRLELGLAEEPGEINLRRIELCSGCADVMYRKFENGLVLLNGSGNTPFTFDFESLFSGESYARIKGEQDPIHNSGKPVEGELVLGPRDGILLKRN